MRLRGAAPNLDVAISLESQIITNRLDAQPLPGRTGAACQSGTQFVTLTRLRNGCLRGSESPVRPSEWRAKPIRINTSEVRLRVREFRAIGVFRETGPIGRMALVAAGAAAITLASFRAAPPEAATLHIHLAPLPAVVTPHGKMSKHRRRNLFAGIASWYGEVLDGHTTASGEIFDKDKLTACHPTLPFGTLVRVVNLTNMRSVVVRINDRGVLDPGRVIDLSSAAADRIGMLRAGVAPVRLEVVRAHG